MFPQPIRKPEYYRIDLHSHVLRLGRARRRTRAGGELRVDSLSALVSAGQLAEHFRDPLWVVLDCRFSLSDPEAGKHAYAEGHIPGARHADLERDLSGTTQAGVTGRHPLPNPETLAATLGQWSIASDTQVVAYDASSGAFAARAWWLLRWLGHGRVAVLDGGLAAWDEAKQPLTMEPPRRPPRVFKPRVRSELLASADEVLARSQDRGATLLDARAAERFRGEREPIDPIAGHIPNALCAPFTDNLQADGGFLPAVELRARWRTLLRNDASPICYCGSGVTACHNLLALEHAGIGHGRLYPGSWSEWITDPGRPIARG